MHRDFQLLYGILQTITRKSSDFRILLICQKSPANSWPGNKSLGYLWANYELTGISQLGRRLRPCKQFIYREVDKYGGLTVTQVWPDCGATTHLARSGGTTEG